MTAVIDTVVAHYFLFTDAFDLLLDLLGRPLCLPRMVFDPDEPHETMEPDAVTSEIIRNIHYRERLARSHGASGDEQDQARCSSQRLFSLLQYVARGEVAILDMAEAELATFARLTAALPDPKLGLLLPLGPGEAACLAIALKRGYVLATDDGDALRALERLRPAHPHQTIRRLLQRATGEHRLSVSEADGLHRRMRALGFWDHEPLFPDEPPA